MTLVLPPTFLLETRLSLNELHDLKEKIGHSLTDIISESNLVIGKVATKQRAIFELRSRQVWTEEVQARSLSLMTDAQTATPHLKRRYVEVVKEKGPVVEKLSIVSKDESSSQIKAQDIVLRQTGHNPSPQIAIISPVLLPISPTVSKPSPASNQSSTMFTGNSDIEWNGNIKVVKLAWLEKCLTAGHLQPLGEYLVYEGKLISHPEHASGEPAVQKVQNFALTPSTNLPDPTRL